MRRGRSGGVAVAIAIVCAAGCASSPTAAPPATTGGGSVVQTTTSAGTSAGTSPGTRAQTTAGNEVTARQITITDPTLGPLTFDALAAGDPSRASEGKLVLLLHGFPETSDGYRAFLGPLADAGYYAVAFDQRGYSPGARPTNVDAYGIVGLAGDAAAVAAELGAPTYHVVGHDWGGAVAWLLGASRPQQVTSLTVLSTPHPDALSEAMNDPASGQADASGYMKTFREPGSEDRMLVEGKASFVKIFGPSAGGLPQDEVERYAEKLGTPAALGAALNWYRANPLPPPVRMGTVKVPTLFVFGGKDGAFRQSTADATGAHVDGPYTYRVLADQGHWLPELAGAAILPDLLTHLAGEDR